MLGDAEVERCQPCLTADAERLALLKTRLYALGSAKEVLTKEVLSQVYGPQILTTDTGHVIVADHHHN